MYTCVVLIDAWSPGYFADLTRRAANGFTPLLSAIYPHQAAAIGELLTLGAPMDLRAAVCLRQAAIVRLMVRDNPQLVHVAPDARDLVAEAASFGGGVDVLRPLLEAGGDPSSRIRPRPVRTSIRRAPGLARWLAVE